MKNWSARSSGASCVKSPAAYIPELIANDGDKAFTSQCIPTDPALLTPERYRDFLAERRRLIVVRLNDFLAP